MEINQNQLYPVFFRLDKLQMLIVGAGEVGMEKLGFILKSSPNAHIKIVATWVSEEVSVLISQYAKQIQLDLKEFDPSDIDGCDIVVAATNFHEVNLSVYHAAKERGKGLLPLVLRLWAAVPS